MFLPGILMFFTFYRTIYVMIIPGRQFNLPGKPVNNKGRLKHCRLQLFRQRHFKAARHLLLQTPILALKKAENDDQGGCCSQSEWRCKNRGICLQRRQLSWLGQVRTAFPMRRPIFSPLWEHPLPFSKDPLCSFVDTDLLYRSRFTFCQGGCGSANGFWWNKPALPDPCNNNKPIHAAIFSLGEQ